MPEVVRAVLVCVVPLSTARACPRTHMRALPMHVHVFASARVRGQPEARASRIRAVHKHARVHAHRALLLPRARTVHLAASPWHLTSAAYAYCLRVPIGTVFKPMRARTPTDKSAV